MPTPGKFSDETPGGGSYAGGGDWIGALIGAGAGLYDSHQNRKTSKENTDKTIAAQKRESELAYQRSVQMWHMQNAYNTPEAQMARFDQAGLNPHMIYGQGSSGLASSPPQYQPANMQYRYEAPQYGAAIAGILPTLMSVGTWMQNMRLTEADLKTKAVQQERGISETERTRQIIDYLQKANPKLLEGLENKLSLFPYQREMQSYNTNIARTKLFELEQDFRHKFGEGLFTDFGSSWSPKREGGYAPIGGMKRLQFLQEASKEKLLEAKSSWSEFDITDPQAIMQMVMQGVLGLAGQSIRLANKPRGKVTHETESRMRGGRTTIRRRHYETK